MNTTRYKIRVIALLLFGVYLAGPAQDTMLCVGRHWTEDQANLMLKKFQKTWNDLESWEKRASMIRSGIIEGIQLERMPSVEGNFNPVITGSHTLNGYIVENIRIESFPGFYITGNLYRPLESQGRHAAILSPHGHLHDKRFTEYVQSRCAVLARMGAVVFAYDMVGFGDCMQVNHRMPIALLLQTYNSKRVLEYLISREDVDPGRIGMTGGSGGATQTFMLAAIDSRIKVSVPVVQVSAYHFGGCVCESGMPIHKSALYQTNNVEIAALCAPRPLMLISNGMDYTSNTPRIEYPYVQKVYALYDSEHKVENAHFMSEKHDYGYSKRAAAYVFFKRHLKLDEDKVHFDPTIQEDFITLLPKEQLSVYTAESPMPDDALMGDGAVMKYLGIEYKQNIENE